MRPQTRKEFAGKPGWGWEGILSGKEKLGRAGLAERLMASKGSGRGVRSKCTKSLRLKCEKYIHNYILLYTICEHIQ